MIYLLQVVLALSAFQKRSDREQPQRPCLKEKPMLSSAFLLKTPDSLLKARTGQSVRDIVETLVRGSLRVTGYSWPSFSERRKRLNLTLELEPESYYLM